MWNKFLVVILLLFTLFPILGQEIDAENPIIVWEEIPSALGYQLQIRDESEEIILEKDVTETSYKLNLAPGKYSHRVGSYNKFGKISSYSEWASFNISRALPPEVTSETSIISYKKELEKKILIEGKNFYKDTQVSLKNETDIVTISKTKFKKGNLEVTIDNEKTKEGNYDLILENPRKKILVLKDFYILKPNPLFSIDTDKPDEEKSMDNTSYPYWGEAARSALLPGWGQIRKDQTYSAIFFDLGIIMSAGYLQSTLNSFQAAKKDYSQSVTQSLLYQSIDGQEFTTFYGFSASEAKFQNTQRASISVFNASILLASFYSLNILDALLWKISAKTPDKTSFHIYTKIQIQPMANNNYPLNSTSNSSQIELGLQIKF